MQILKNISLKEYNTFGIDARAEYFSTFQHSNELAQCLDARSALANKNSSDPLLILGGGSNLLFVNDIRGWALKNEIKGIEKSGEDEEYVYVRAGAGESWHGFVLCAIENGWGGVENLSLIPGNVGASPMQNIGAYGVEIQEVFHELRAYHLHEHAIRKFTKADCEFGYRESIFKRRYKNQYAILDVTLKLRKNPVFNIKYGAIAEELEKMGVGELSLNAISNAIINIRSSKLPDPREIGNAGSFFKNPSVDKEKFGKLQAEFPGIVGYENPDQTIKLAAGWLIEQAGWKGFREGDAGVHSRQSLVLVNYQHANGKQIFDLSERIIMDIQSRFGVALEREVNII